MNFIISGVVSLLVAIFTAFVTAKITLKQEVKKRIYEKRESLYIDLFGYFCRLNKNNDLVFNSSDFVNPLMQLKPRLYLFASREVISKVEPLLNEIQSTSDKYFEKFSGEQYEMQKLSRKEYDGETDEQFELEEENYKKEHLISCKWLQDSLHQIATAMRQDIGTKNNDIKNFKKK